MNNPYEPPQGEPGPELPAEATPFTGRMFAMVMAFEAGLGFLALLLAWLGDVPIRRGLVLSQAAVVRGIAASLPMFALLLLTMHSQWRPLAELRKQLHYIVRSLFAGSRWWELALVSIAAGVGEEMLFRGALIPLAAKLLPTFVAVVAVGIVFGLLHALSTTYFLAATAIGVYLGWLAVAYDDLVAPIVAHAVYDFVALMYVMRSDAKQ